jgi:hypothetical protein
MNRDNKRNVWAGIKKQRATHPRREGLLPGRAGFTHGRFVDYMSRGHPLAGSFEMRPAEFVHRFLTFPQTV